MDNPSPQVVKQRIRNRIIDWCEWCVDFETCDYQDFAELINFWNDWWDSDDIDYYGPPVFTLQESQALAAVEVEHDRLCEATKILDPLDFPRIYALKEWTSCKRAAQVALTLLMSRGRLSEEEDMADH